ncbi:transcriptional regulator [Sphingobium sp. AEW4]|nr:transcriptional regulator [Sphingobium sp. AEW4]
MAWLRGAAEPSHRYTVGSTQYVEREEKRETFRQDAIQAWDEYQQTGLHLTLEEADAWLAKLEAGEDAEPPKCHG